MEIKQVLKVRQYKAGYEVRTELIDDSEEGGSGFEMKSAYNPNGNYIGNSRDAYRLCKVRGIRPELAKPTNNVCSIGFCEKEQKWFGWSHRPIYGFGIGSTCKKGDCHYRPTDKEDFLEDCVRFWSEDSHENVEGFETTNEGITGVRVTWTYSKKIPNKKLRGKVGGAFEPYPESFGKGEWTAKTLEDAKEMARDFAEGVG